ncbi:uncharacterized protein DUF1707 [Actinocrispum wychmicini]|uniref:Uncharacterized protein DUF1707 n=2 Tax=Actinocrispum wychmicini TaxID=1213861 RepID=A0A4R2K6M8_9PSEU|nr:uncharacterized protein DUF1707 [Actinocrispum wychmicini]
MNLRVGDAERDESARLLSEHFGAGRISPAEHEERRAKAMSAVIRSELEVLFEDLPAPHPDMSAAQPPARTDSGEALRETRLSNALILMAGILFIGGVPASFVLGFTSGLWWVFLPVFGGVFVIGGASELAKRRRLQD